MKVSLSLLKQIASENDLPLNESDLEQKIGAQLGAIEETTSLSDVYKDALLVRVVTASPLEGSDHLSLCTIDDKGTFKEVERSNEGLIQVVCGAPNVSEGQIVVWLPPGSVVPSSYHKDRFVLEARKIMGQVSNGMLASAKELAISDDHNGIVVLPPETAYGVSFKDYLSLDDRIIDIENKMFTHRPDLFGHLGIARELAGIYGRQFKSPEWYKEDALLSVDKTDRLTIDNRLSDSACPRFSAVYIDNLKVEPSPLWLQSYLTWVGIRPINNLVDITNYVMVVTGQPLHAYDFNKIAEDERVQLIIRSAQEKEKLELLDGSNIELTQSDIVIANQHQAIGLGGVMGGAKSEIDNNTTAIILECASFNMYSIRRSSMSHGIFSEAVTRFSKGQSKRQCLAAMSFALDLIKQLNKQAQIAEVVDSYKGSAKNEDISVLLEQVNSYLGIDLDPKEMAGLLNNTELNGRIDQSRLVITPPFWRTDLEAPEDIIEEVARLYGFDNLPIKLMNRTVGSPATPKLVEVKRQIRQALASAGANETLNYSFVDQKLLLNVGQDPKKAYSLSNALSPELKYYRLSLLPSLLAKVHINHKAGYDRFALYEVGKIHQIGLSDEQGLPLEPNRLALVVSANTKTAQTYYEGPAYYQGVSFLYYLFDYLGLDSDSLEFQTPDNLDDSWKVSVGSMLLPGRSASLSVNGRLIGIMGEFTTSVSHQLKLNEYGCGFELDLDYLSELILNKAGRYHQLSKYPSLTQDLTVTLKDDNNYQSLRSKLYLALEKMEDSDVSFKLRPIDAYQAANSATTNWTFRLEAGSNKRTLTDKQVNEYVEKLIKAA